MVHVTQLLFQHSGIYITNMAVVHVFVALGLVLNDTVSATVLLIKCLAATL